MDNNKEKLNFLLLKLENLALKQQGLEEEINNLRVEINQVNKPFAKDLQQNPIQEKPVPQSIFPPKNTVPAFNNPSNVGRFAQERASSIPKFKKEDFIKSDFEKFIGENLISKIGILIVVIGVIIGAKYAIDNNLISPLTRIVLGYLLGTALAVLALKLKAQYENFSAVLLSGAIAIFYFITYAGYSLYGLFPQVVAFIFMVVFTCFGVLAAIKYNKQVIAHIGLVGAYAVPFLLSNGSGNVTVLFSYMVIINLGILAISLKKYWKPLLYNSFGFTWLIFLIWLLDSYNSNLHFTVALIASSIFFGIFYITNLSYKISKAEVFSFIDVIIILANSFIYYGIGYYVISTIKDGSIYLGLFTLINAIVHFGVALFIYRKKLADKNLFYLILALVITFITIAVPVQLNGGWVTIFWTMEAALLFYLGRNKNIPIYEKLSYPLIFISFISLIQDWFTYGEKYENVQNQLQPLLNVGFLSSLICLIAFGWMIKINLQQVKNQDTKPTFSQILNYILPSIFIIIAYFTFKNEIELYYNNLFENSKITIRPSNPDGYQEYRYNYQLENLKTAWVFAYTLIFAACLSWVNLKKIKNEQFAWANTAINLLVVIAFLTFGLWNLSELRDAYKYKENILSLNSLGQKQIVYFTNGPIAIYIRYFSILALALLLWVFYQLSKSELIKKWPKTAFDYIFYITLLWILSSELINIVSLNYLKGSYKLVLSILWGIYSLFLICIGLWKNKKHLRIGAIALFGITLIKLFLYDISNMETISKTFLFVFLGLLLLLISFLYNKYKHLIIDKADEN